MKVESAKYNKDTDDNNVSVNAVIDGQAWSVPINAEHNRHWKALQAWVADGNTIDSAD